MPVSEMLGRMSSQEITDWLAYFKVKAKYEDEARKKAEREAKKGKR